MVMGMRRVRLRLYLSGFMTGLNPPALNKILNTHDSHIWLQVATSCFFTGVMGLQSQNPPVSMTQLKKDDPKAIQEYYRRLAVQLIGDFQEFIGRPAPPKRGRPFKRIDYGEAVSTSITLVSQQRGATRHQAEPEAEASPACGKAVCDDYCPDRLNCRIRKYVRPAGGST